MRSIREADLRHALGFLRVVGEQSASAHRFAQIATASVGSIVSADLVTFSVCDLAVPTRAIGAR